VKTIDVGIMDIDVKTIISKQGFKVERTTKRILCNRYEPKVALKDKAYPKSYTDVN
jgi:hypothetical protein